MRTVRIWLLVLLAVLLPVRGAMAAAMLCPVADAGPQSALHLNAVADARWTAHEGMDQALGDHASMHHDHASGVPHDHGAGQPDKCNMCSAFCSLTPLMSSVPAIVAPQAVAAISYPALSAPAPSFLSDGQERPPRSI